MQPTKKVRSSLQLNEQCFEWTISNWKLSSFMKNPMVESFVVTDMNTKLRMCLVVMDDKLQVSVGFDKFSDLEKCSIGVYFLFKDRKIKLLESSSFILNGEDAHKALKIIPFNSSEKYSLNDELVILCEIKYASSTSETPAQIYDKKIVLNDFGQLFRDKKFCDVVFLTSNEEISAHIAVLAAVSPYFLAMFDNPNTIENQKRVVDFRNDKDVTANNLRGFLEYIYGSKSITELVNIVSDLLVLADKFGVEQLRKTCECYMSESIDRENVVDILILSDKYHCELLKKKAISFARMHIDTVKSSKKFNELCRISDIIHNLL